MRSHKQGEVHHTMARARARLRGRQAQKLGSCPVPKGLSGRQNMMRANQEGMQGDQSTPTAPLDLSRRIL